MMPRILWADDEIDLLKPYIIFLQQKGYQVLTTNNGQDALDICSKEQLDIVFLDENMPGLSGLETLQDIKRMRPALPVVMITKSEEENIMEEAIGEKIADYLIKPVNPSQILLCLKKHIHERTILEEHTSAAYREGFSDMAYMINSATSLPEWQAIYKALTKWDIQLAEARSSMADLLRMQRNEANAAFFKFVQKNYAEWMKQHPGMMSTDIFKQRVFPLLDKGEKIALVVIDNFRYDQWLAIQPTINEIFSVENEEMYTSILPTATQYARNAIFAGLMPDQIRTMYPHFWVEEGDDDSKNQFEKQLIESQINRYRRHDAFCYYKINESDYCEKVIQKIKGNNQQLCCIVLNFIDMLSHSRTESKMMRELCADEEAYRSLTLSWFKHSPTFRLFQQLAKQGYKLLLTTDHGTVRVDRPILITADKNTNTNLRYKVGKALVCKEKDTYTIHNPKAFGLPAPNISSSYVFCSGKDFFGYPNNFNYYSQYYTGTFQHGGISMEEMIIPLVVLVPKNTNQ